jgi:hypothetical protein
MRLLLAHSGQSLRRVILVAFGQERTLRRRTDRATRLNLKNDNPLTGKLAAKIVSHAADGERDVGKLVEQALIGLK